MSSEPHITLHLPADYNEHPSARVALKLFCDNWQVFLSIGRSSAIPSLHWIDDKVQEKNIISLQYLAL